MNLIAMVAKFKGWLAAAAAILIGFGLAYLSGKKDEEHSNEIKQKDAEIEQTKVSSAAIVSASVAAKTVQKDVSSSSNSAVDDELSNRFTRD